MAKIRWTVEKGHLGAEPEISTVKGGRLMAKVSIAVNRYRKDDDGEWEEVGITTWINGTAFGYPAELIEAMELEKGDAVYAEGQMYQQEWYDEEYDEDVVSWEFLIDRLFEVPKVFEEDEEEDSGRSKKRGRSKRRGSRIKGKKKKGRGSKSKGSSRSKKRKPKIKKKNKSGASSIAEKVAKQLQGG